LLELKAISLEVHQLVRDLEGKIQKS